MDCFDNRKNLSSNNSGEVWDLGCFNHTGNPSLLPISTTNIILVALIVTMTLCGNVTIIFSYFANYKMRTVTNIMVVNMCSVDILSVVGEIPFYILAHSVIPIHTSYSICRVALFFDHLFKSASVLSMAGIAVDRYFNLVRTSLRRLTEADVPIVIAMMWLQATVASLPWDLLFSSPKADAQRMCRSLPWLYSPGVRVSSITIFFTVTCLLLPSVMVGYVFWRVMKSVSRRRRLEGCDDRISPSSRSGTTDRFALHTYAHSSMTAILLFSLYILLASPFLVAAVWFMASKEDIPQNTAFAVIFIFRLKGVFFPILYLLRNRLVLIYVQQKLQCCFGGAEGARAQRRGDVEMEVRYPRNKSRTRPLMKARSVDNSDMGEGQQRRPHSSMYKVFTVETAVNQFTDLNRVSGEAPLSAGAPVSNTKPNRYASKKREMITKGKEGKLKSAGKTLRKNKTAPYSTNIEFKELGLINGMVNVKPGNYDLVLGSSQCRNCVSHCHSTCN